ncbi:hypothetical protein V8E51_000062 [Hyaloscypha variabilis]
MGQTNSTIPGTIPEETALALRHGTKDPIPVPDPNRPFTVEELHRIELHKAYQRTLLNGFTIQEVDVCGAWSIGDAKPSDLTLPFHPIYDRKAWFVGKTAKLDPFYTQIWDVKKEEELWNVLKPSLRLATLMLTTAGLSPWLDALMDNQWQVVPASDVKDGCPTDSGVYNTYSIHTRSPIVASQSTKKVQDSIENLQGNLRIEISPTLRSKNNFAWAYHRQRSVLVDKKKKYAGSTITLSLEMILPLKKTDLSVSERIVQQFGVAKTIAHETIHALGAYAKSRQPIPFESAEPFFEDDVLCELGRSWETFMFGGATCPLRNDAELHRPYLAHGLEEWPNWNVYQNGCFNLGKAPTRFRQTDVFEPGNAKDRFDTFPIRISYMEDVQQRSFWQSVVPALGQTALKPPQILGRTRVRKRFPIRRYGKDWTRWVNIKTLEAMDVPDLPTNATSAAQWQNAQDIRNRASAVKITLEIQDARKKGEQERLLEKQNPGQRARREEKEKRDEAEETKLLDHALLIYDPEDESPSMKIYESLRSSRFTRVRAECFSCLSVIDLLAGTPELGEKQRRLANQEALLIDQDDPARQRILENGRKIIGLKSTYEKEKREGKKRKKVTAATGDVEGKKQKQSSTAMDIDNDSDMIVEGWERSYYQ